MNQITVDESWGTRLRNVHGPAEVRDEAGALLGHYTPVHTPEEIAALQEQARKLFDFDKAREVAERERGQGCSIEEIWERQKATERR